MHQLGHTPKHPQWLHLGTGHKRNQHLEALDMTWHGLKVARSNTSKTKFRFSLLHNASTGKMCLQLRDLGNEKYTSPRRIEGNMVWIEASNVKDFHLSQRSVNSNEIVATSYYLNVNQFHGQWRMQHYCCFFYMAIQSWLYTYYRFYYVSSWYGNIQYIFLSWYIVAILFD